MKRTALNFFSVYSYYDKAYPIKISKNLTNSLRPHF